MKAVKGFQDSIFDENDIHSDELTANLNKIKNDSENLFDYEEV